MQFKSIAAALILPFLAAADDYPVYPTSDLTTTMTSTYTMTQTVTISKVHSTTCYNSTISYVPSSTGGKYYPTTTGGPVTVPTSGANAQGVVGASLFGIAGIVAAALL